MSKTYKKASGRLKLLKRLRTSLTITSSLAIYSAMLLLDISYCAVYMELYINTLKIENTLSVKISSAKNDEIFVKGRKLLPTKIFTDELFLPTNIFCQRKFKIALFCNNFSCRSKVLGSLRPKSDLLRIYSVWDPTYARK